MRILVALVLVVAISAFSEDLTHPELGDGSTMTKERPYDKAKGFASNKGLWRAAANGNVADLKAHLAKVTRSGTNKKKVAKAKAMIKAATQVKAAKAKKKKMVKKLIKGALKKAALKAKTAVPARAVKSKVECSLLREENAALQTTKELLTYKNAQVSVDRNQLKRSASYLGKQNAKLRKDIADLKLATAKEGKLFSGNMKLISDNTRLAAENNVLSKQKANLQKTVSLKIGIIAKRENTIGTQKAIIGDKTVKIKTQQAEIKIIQQQLTASKARATKLAAELRSTKEALKSQVANNKLLQKANEGLKGDLAKEKLRYQKQTAHLQHQKVLHVSLTKRNAKLQAHAASLTAKVRQTRSKLEALRKTVARARKAAATAGVKAQKAAAMEIKAKDTAQKERRQVKQALKVKKALKKVQDAVSRPLHSFHSFFLLCCMSVAYSTVV